jgi:hypothetical protein
MHRTHRIDSPFRFARKPMYKEVHSKKIAAISPGQWYEVKQPHPDLPIDKLMLRAAHYDTR